MGVFTQLKFQKKQFKSNSLGKYPNADNFRPHPIIKKTGKWFITHKKTADTHFNENWVCKNSIYTQLIQKLTRVFMFCLIC